MKIATARTRTSKKWRTVDITWEQFLDRLRTPMRTAETMAEYRGMAKEEQGRAKEAAGGFVGGALSSGQRKTENVVSRSLITLDADDAYVGQWDNVTALLDYRMACYPTHSSTTSKPRLRWVIPTDREMTPDEYPAVARMVASWIGIDTMDASTYEVARLMYWPTIPKDAPYEYHEQDGDVLSVDYVLSLYGPGELWRNTYLWPTADGEQEVRARAQKKAGDPASKPGLVGLFCRTYDIYSAIDTFLSDVYEPTAEPDRYTYVGGTTAAGAVVYQDGAFLYSNHATDPAGGQCLNAFDLVRIHKFGELDADVDAESVGVTKLPSYQAMSSWAAELPEIKELGAREQNEAFWRENSDLFTEQETKTETAAGSAEGAENLGDKQTANPENAEQKSLEKCEESAQMSVEKCAEETPEWMAELKRNPKTGKIEETRTNAQILIRNLPAFKGKLGYNPMRDSITVDGGLPWRERRVQCNEESKTSLDHLFTDAVKREKETEWNANDWPDFYAYMERLGFATGKQKTNGLLDHALLSVALEHEHHPIKSYLSSLVWDGTERLDTLFIRWLGAEDTPLNREITKLWMIAAVDRVVRPGCQFDSMLITVGPQGIGKSRLLRILSQGFYTNSLKALEVGKTAGEILQGVWIAEIGELDAMRKSEQTSIKNFLTSTSDRFRAAYARDAVTHPRQCVFAGTSNKGAFLRDETGERRYWIMKVKGTGDKGLLQGFEKEVDQLWAEAVVLWKQRMFGYREPGQLESEVNTHLYLTGEMEQSMTQVQTIYKLPDEDRIDVLGYLDTLRPDNWYDLPAYERQSFAQNNWVGDQEKCTLRIDRVSIREIAYELMREERGSKTLRIGDILDSSEQWKKQGQARIKGYTKYPVPVWVRVGGAFDHE